MSDYRPLTDVMILARAKLKGGHKYYGSFPAGFLHRARHLMRCSLADPVVFLCGGRVRDYPYRGVGKYDKTVDLDPTLEPDFLQDAELPIPPEPTGRGYGGVLADRPYTPEDAKHYKPGPEKLPNLNRLLAVGLAAIRPGGCVGTFDYLWPAPPDVLCDDGKYRPLATEVGAFAVGTGRNSRARWFVVWEQDPSVKPLTLPFDIDNADQVRIPSTPDDVSDDAPIV